MGLFGLFAPEDSRGSFLRKAFDRGELERVARPHRPTAKLKGDAIVLAPRGGTYDVQARAPRAVGAGRRGHHPLAGSSCEGCPPRR